jgi:hypothetical protein
MGQAMGEKVHCHLLLHSTRTKGSAGVAEGVDVVLNISTALRDAQQVSHMALSFCVYIYAQHTQKCGFGLLPVHGPAVHSFKMCFFCGPSLTWLIFQVKGELHSSINACHLAPALMIAQENLRQPWVFSFPLAESRHWYLTTFSPAHLCQLSGKGVVVYGTRRRNSGVHGCRSRGG